MNRAIWGVFVIMLGVTGIIFITLFQTITNNDEHNSQKLKEVTEAAMWDAVDYTKYRAKGLVTINKEKFAENFIRRFGEVANKSNTYRIRFYDVNETPPKVSVEITSTIGTGSLRATVNDEDMVDSIRTNHRIDAILETPY